MKEFDKKTDGSLVLDKIDFHRVLCRKVRKANDRGDKISIPKELNLRDKYVFIVIPKKP